MIDGKIVQTGGKVRAAASLVHSSAASDAKAARAGACIAAGVERLRRDGTLGATRRRPSPQ